ncbi:MAG: hypothetical protein RRZ24_01310 [Clostridia bacterium]
MRSPIKKICVYLSVALLLSGCTGHPISTSDVDSIATLPEKLYSDGLYRGFYNDGGIEQLSVEFELKGNTFVFVRYKSINYKDGNYLGENATNIQSQVASQFQQAAMYLIDKPVSAIMDLLDSTIVVSDRDAVTSATLRTNKLASALQDGLNRGVFSATDTTKLSLPDSAADGRYRGFYFDGVQEQVSVEFNVENNIFTFIQLRTPAANATPDAALYASAVAELTGKPLLALCELYLSTADNSSYQQAAAMGKLISAFLDALNRGVYSIVSTTVLPTLSNFKNGVYRGFYYEGGIEQVSVQFEIVNDTFVSIRYRGLNYTDGNYLAEDAGAPLTTLHHQYLELTDYLIGKNVSHVYDLFAPENIATDADGYSAATLCSNKLVSALMDGLTRGIYRAEDLD